MAAAISLTSANPDTFDHMCRVLSIVSKTQVG